MNMKGVLHISFLMLAATLLVLPVSGAFAVTGINPDQGLNTDLVWINNLSGTDLPQDAGVILMRPASPTSRDSSYIGKVRPESPACLTLAGKPRVIGM